MAQAVFVVIRLLRGVDVQWFAILFNLTVVSFAGLLGGFLGQRLRRPRVRSEIARTAR